MYTFQAIADINTVNDHGGFYFIAWAAGIISVLLIMFADDIMEARVYIAILGVMVGIAAAVSYNTGEVKVYANTKVEATLVGFHAEGFNIEERHGKQTRRVDKHEQFVVYAVPEGNIMFPATLGQTYPPKAILYKN